MEFPANGDLQFHTHEQTFEPTVPRAGVSKAREFHVRAIAPDGRRWTYLVGFCAENKGQEKHGVFVPGPMELAAESERLAADLNADPADAEQLQWIYVGAEPGSEAALMERGEELLDIGGLCGSASAEDEEMDLDMV